MKRKTLVAIIGCIFIICIAGSSCGVKTIRLEIPCGTKVDGVYYQSQTDGKRPAILILPGLSGLRTSWKDDYERFAKWLNKEYDFNVLVIDYRAKSTKELMKMAKRRQTTTLVKEEITVALNYLRSQKTVDKGKIGLTGFSFGTVLAIMTAAREDSVKTLALISIILPPKEHWRSYNPDLEQDLSKYANRPVLFIADNKDDIRQNNSNAAENALYWSQQVENAKVKITDSGFHSLELLQVRGVKKTIGDWLQEHLS